MKKLPALLSLCVLAALLFHACESEDCPPNALAYAHLSLVNQYGNAIRITVPVTVIGQVQADVTVHDTLADGSIVERVVRDSLLSDTLVNQESGASSFSLPLSYGSETRFIISYDGQDQDRITIKHRNIPYFMNVDCGTMMFHQIGEATTTFHQIDSLVVTNPNIDNNEKENIKLYFTVADTAE